MLPVTLHRFSATPRKLLLAGAVALIVALAGGVQSAAASGPGWVHWGFDGYCSRDVRLDYNGVVHTAADFNCTMPVTLKFTVQKSGTTLYTVYPVRWYRTDTGFRAAISKDFGACAHGNVYQVFVGYTVSDGISPIYSGTINSGQHVLC